MSDDLRLDAGFLDHPKTKRLIRRLGDVGVVALVRLWSYTSRFFPKGVLTGFLPGDIEEAAGWSGTPGEFVSALREAGGPGKAGFLDVVGDAYSLHNWKRRQRFAYFRPERSAQAQRANDARWEGRRKEKQGVNPNRIPDGIQEGSPNRNPPLPPPLHKDLKDLSSESAVSDSSIPPPENEKGITDARSLFDVWNEEARFLPKAREINESRKRKIKTRLRERSLEEWRQIFRRMNASPFLRGESGNGTFRADLDWIISNENNAVKVLEGRYDDRAGIHPASQGTAGRTLGNLS
jgi:hypothetical protein